MNKQRINNRQKINVFWRKKVPSLELRNKSKLTKNERKRKRIINCLFVGKKFYYIKLERREENSMRSQCLRDKNLICERVESCFPKTYLFNLLVLFRDSFPRQKIRFSFHSIRGYSSDATTKRSEFRRNIRQDIEDHSI